MEKTTRGLELTRTEWGSDAQLLFSTVKTAAHTESIELKRQIECGNPENFLSHAIALAAISEIWLWADGIYRAYRNTPAVLLAVPIYAQHIDEWHEDMGAVLWWRDPITEPPYVGTPLDSDFDETYQWWSPIDTPKLPKREAEE